MGHYEDRMTIDTPEGVTMTLPLAGVGSRFVAAGVDVTIQLLLLGAAFVVFGTFEAAGAASGGAFAICFFLVFFVYDVAFEVLAGGRTPGKRANGLRVVRTGGQPIGFVASTIRNLLRVVDLLPGFYLVGIVSILVTRRNQRLGDLAAGTVVARAPRRRARLASPPPEPETLPAALSAWDVSAVTAGELAAVRSFLERRHALTHAARVELARTMAERLRPRVGGVPAEEALGDELFLERLAHAKAARG
jgi:uncharacterized RDD family membrane protein YckC